MATKLGTISVGAQTDRRTAKFVRDESNRLGISKSELIRRLIAHYEESRLGEHHCPNCGQELNISL